jgi:hypothetical protein
VQEDGYTIIKEFAHSKSSHYKQTLGYLKSNKYSSDFFDKHHLKISSWAFLEIAPFGSMIGFLNFYQIKYPVKKLARISKLLNYAKNIRNAAAHNNPIMINLYSPSKFFKKPERSIIFAAKDLGLSRDDVQDIKINDLVALFALFKILCSNSSKKHTRRAGERLINRFNRHPEYYISADPICRFKKTLSILIDSL